MQTQCAKSIIHGNYNKSRIEQEQWWKGLQFGLHVQNGDNNVAYTGQSGTNDFAVTVQNGDNNTSGTHQVGAGLGSVTVQNGNGGWSSTSMAGNGGTAVSYQSN